MQSFLRTFILNKDFHTKKDSHTKEDFHTNCPLSDPEWFNINLIQERIRVCDTTHGKECKKSGIRATSTWSQPPRSDRAGDSVPLQTGPKWLIDVKNQCIVPAQSHRYIALSYVWGGVRATEATVATIATLQQPGALSFRSKYAEVPKTVRHAMGLLQCLNERYLWVDRLCICQDDTEEKHSQIVAMGHIYERAYYTIVFADGGDADYGLRGIKGITEPLPFTSDAHGNKTFMRKGVDLSCTKWYSRAWTFQEMVLSPRKLIFNDSAYAWECSGGYWPEYFANPVKYGWQKDLREKGRERCYFDLIAKYNNRDLTFPEDGLNAFLGVIPHFLDCFPSGFLWGLPIDMLHLALLWWPTTNAIGGRGRRNSKQAAAIQLPSWSWCGWQGYVDFPESKEIIPTITLSYNDDGVSVALEQGNVLSVSNRRSDLTQQASTTLLVHGSVARCKIGDAEGVVKNSTTGSALFLTSAKGAMSLCGMVRHWPPHSRTQGIYNDCELLSLACSKELPGLASEWRDELAFKFQATECGPHGYVIVILIERVAGVAYRKEIGFVMMSAWELMSPNRETLYLQ